MILPQACPTPGKRRNRGSACPGFVWLGWPLGSSKLTFSRIVHLPRRRRRSSGRVTGYGEWSWRIWPTDLSTSRRRYSRSGRWRRHARFSFLICQFRSKSLIRWEFSRSLSYQRSSAILIYSEDRCEHAWDNGPVVPHPELFLFYGAGRVGNSGL